MAEFAPVPNPAGHPDATRSYSVHDGGRPIGLVVLELLVRPSGATLRRDWWAIPPAGDPRGYTRPFTTRSSAVQGLRYRAATLNPPPTPQPTDHTLEAILATRRDAGPAAAAWLAATLVSHHMHELEDQRQANPPSLWREIRRATTWLDAATHGYTTANVHYRLTSSNSDEPDTLEKNHPNG